MNLLSINTTPAPNLPRLAEWHGYFLGHDLTFLHAELLAIQHVPESLLKKEAELMRKKWFDYRRMHPTVATYLFAHCFNRAYQDFMVAVHDRSGQYMRAFKQLDFMEAHEKLAVWRLRQLADSLGMRYDFFLRHAFKQYSHDGWFLKKLDKGRVAAPRPSHINANTEVVANVMLAWEEECAARIQYPVDTRYKAYNWIGHVDQLDWERYLVEQIKTRRHPKFALGSALYIERALRIETAIREFDERVLEEALFESGVR